MLFPLKVSSNYIKLLYFSFLYQLQHIGLAPLYHTIYFAHQSNVKLPKNKYINSIVKKVLDFFNYNNHHWSGKGDFLFIMQLS